MPKNKKDQNYKNKKFGSKRRKINKKKFGQRKTLARSLTTSSKLRVGSLKAIKAPRIQNPVIEIENPHLDAQEAAGIE